MPAYNADQILSRYWNNSIPVDPILIAKNMGAEVLSNETIEYDGEFFIYAKTPMIRYRPSGNTRRDRFTIAHEIGHFVLDHGEAHRDSMKSFNIGNFNYFERDANRFAAELLMPTHVVKFALLEAGMTSVETLSDYFDVSTTAMRIRLQNLGYL